MRQHIRNLRYLLSAREQRQALVLLALMAVGSLLDMLSVGSIPAFIALLSNADSFTRHPLTARLMAWTGVASVQGLVLAAALALMLLFLVKNSYLAGLSYLQARFTTNRQARIAERLFAAYLRTPYTFHLQRNSADLVRNASQISFQAVGMGLLPLLQLALQCMTVTAILGLLLWVEPFISVAALVVLGGASYLFQRFLRSRVQHVGRRWHEHMGRMIQVVNEGLGGIKTTKVLGREEHFLARFTEQASGAAAAGRFLQVTQDIPRVFLETAAIMGILMVAAVFVAQGRAVQQILPVLSLFAVAVVRMIPSFNQITNAISSMRYSRHSLQEISDDLRAQETAGARSGAITAPLPFRQLIRLEGVSYRYPGAAIPSLRDVTLDVPQGATIGFVGPTGSGKTTLVDIIMGLLEPSAGAVLVDGVDIRAHLPRWQRNIGYVPQDIFLSDDTIRRNIAFGLADRDVSESAVLRAMEAAQVREFVERLPNGLDTEVGERGVRLSGGERQRIGIARALYHDPQILVLDEATSALDQETERAVMDAVDFLRGTRTILIIAHRLTTVAACDQIVTVRDGALSAAAELGLTQVPDPAPSL